MEDTTWCDGIDFEFGGRYKGWVSYHGHIDGKAFFLCQYGPGESLIKQRKDGWWWLHADSPTSHEVKKEMGGPFETAKEAILFANERKGFNG